MRSNLTRDFKAMQDYIEASQGQGEAFIGSFKTAPFPGYHADVKTRGPASPYFGQVFCPERLGRTDIDPVQEVPAWSYEKNQAFIAGVIDANRPVRLIADISFYQKKITGTVDEIVWLADNGYTFIPDPNNPLDTLILPPDPPRAPEQRIINYYENGRSLTPSERTEMYEKFLAIRRNILVARPVSSPSPR